MSSLSPLADWAAAQKLPLSEQQLQQFATYQRLLLDWTRRMNLTAILEPRQIVIRHFIDSLTCAQATGDLSGRTLIDVGTGAGFPGLPLKILYPELNLTLTDSVAKKTHFLQAVIEALGLSGVTVIAERAELLGQDPAHRERYEWAVARSVAELRVLAEYLLPLAGVEHHVLAQKGTPYAEELAAAGPAIATLGGAVASVTTATLPEVEAQHALIVLDKVMPTDSRYPRRPGIPTKRPL